MHTVKARKQLAVWVSPETHARFTAVAAKDGLSVATLLGELVEEAFGAKIKAASATVDERELRPDRVAIRLRPGDAQALARRAGARRMKPSTYIAALVRAHLVQDPPLPPTELAALERATAELSAVGRNLNQIARAVNAGAPAPAGTASLVGRSLEAVEAVREATKVYVRKAVAGWEAPLG